MVYAVGEARNWVLQVAVPSSVAELKMMGCAVQPVIAVPPLRNSTLPPIPTAAVPVSGATVAVKMTDALTGAGLEDEVSVVVEPDLTTLKVCPPELLAL